MSQLDSKNPWGNPPSRPQPTAQPDFAPVYEAQVNYRLRNFDQLEGQIGPDVSKEGRTGRKIATATRKKKLVVGVLSLAMVLLLAGVIAGVVVEKNRASTTSQTTTDSIKHQTRQDGSLEASIAPVTITTHITTTKIATTSVIQTTTAPIPTSIVQAAKSFFDSIRSVEASIHSSAESALSEALTFPTVPSASPPVPTTLAETTLATSTSTSSTLPFTPHLICGEQAGCVTAAHVLTSTVGSESPESTVTTSSGAWIGFCSVPGMFCERDVEVDEIDAEV